MARFCAAALVHEPAAGDTAAFRGAQFRRRGHYGMIVLGTLAILRGGEPLVH